jgi:hypothetical protein
MDTAYRTVEAYPAKSKQVKPSKKSKEIIPEGYISSEEFSAIFEKKLLDAYANL